MYYTNIIFDIMHSLKNILLTLLDAANLQACITLCATDIIIMGF